MNTPSKIDELFVLLHEAGWSIGDAAFDGQAGRTWLVYGTQGGYELRVDNSERTEAWKEACRQARELGLIDPL